MEEMRPDEPSQPTSLPQEATVFVEVGGPPVYTADTLGYLDSNHDPARPRKPLHEQRIAQAYLRVAREKGGVSQEDIFDYFKAMRISAGRVRASLQAYVPDHEAYAEKACARARLLGPIKPPKRKHIERTSSPVPIIEISPQELVDANVMSTKETVLVEPRDVGMVALSSQVSPDMIVGTHRRMLTNVDSDELSRAIVPLAHTPFKGTSFDRKRVPRAFEHRHLLSINSDEMVGTCTQPEIVVNDEQRLILNILLLFGRYGIATDAFTAVGIAKPDHSLKELHDLLNIDNHPVMVTEKLGSVSMQLLNPDPRQMRIKDRRNHMPWPRTVSP